MCMYSVPPLIYTVDLLDELGLIVCIAIVLTKINICKSIPHALWSVKPQCEQSKCTWGLQIYTLGPETGTYPMVQEMP